MTDHAQITTFTLWAVLTFNESHDGRGTFEILLSTDFRVSPAVPVTGLRLELCRYTGRYDDAARHLARFLHAHPSLMQRCSANPEIKALFNLG